MHLPELAGAAAAEVHGADLGGDTLGWSSRGRRTRRSLTSLVAVIVPVLALGWIGLHWSTVTSGTDLLGHARGGWLIGAAATVGLTWMAGALCQQGAILQRLPARPLLAVQFAGSAANQFLPAGIGVAAVNVRFLQKQGATRSTALRSVGLNTGAGASVHLVALVALFCVGLVAPRVFAGRALLVLALVAILAGAGVVLIAVPRLRRWAAEVLGRQVRAAADQWFEVARRPVRVMQLWVGSAAVPVLHASTLALLTTSLDGHISIGSVFGAYFLASTVSAAVPSPGGFGALDAALILALTAGGLGATTALAAVIGYRLLTVWIPLLPSACVMGVLRHRAII